MSNDMKRMCKLDKDTIKKDFAGFSKAVRNAEFACIRCGRVAVDKKHLCKPEKLEKQ